MTEFVKGGECTVKHMKKILESYDDDTVLKFKWCNDTWNLSNYWEKDGELVFTQSSRKVKEMSNRFVPDHTARKGFWVEDWMTGRKYFFDDDKQLEKLLRILNGFEKRLNGGDDRFVLCFNEKKLKVIRDEDTGREYFVGDSNTMKTLVEYLNQYNYLINGHRKLKYERIVM